MHSDTLSKIVDIRVFLINNDILFKENPNGYFQVYEDDGELIMDICAITEEALLRKDNKYVTSNHVIKKYIEDNYLEEVKVLPQEVDADSIAAKVIRTQLSAALEEIQNGGTIRILSAAVELPTGAVELITNYNNIESKVNYYLTAYDEALRLKNNPDVRIVGILIV